MSQAKITELSDQIKACRICYDTPLFEPPMAVEPRPVCIISSKAKIVLSGQAPGMRVFNTGIPFNDPSGDRLREWLGVDRDVFYNPDNFAIVPMGFCFPGYDKNGGDLPPRKECAMTWHERIYAAMPQIDVVIVIGQYAQKYHLGAQRKKNLTETVRSWREYISGSTAHDDISNKIIIPLPHPSWHNNNWLKKNEWFSSELLPFMREIVQKNINLRKNF